MKHRLVVAAAVVVGATAAGTTPAATTDAAANWKNCTTVQQKYPHGVGKSNARDKTSGTPVTNFKRSTSLYNHAMSHNRGLDRDSDGVACEKA